MNRGIGSRAGWSIGGEIVPRIVKCCKTGHCFVVASLERANFGRFLSSNNAAFLKPFNCYHLNALHRTKHFYGGLVHDNIFTLSNQTFTRPRDLTTFLLPLQKYYGVYIQWVSIFHSLAIFLASFTRIRVRSYPAPLQQSSVPSSAKPSKNLGTQAT